MVFNAFSIIFLEWLTQKNLSGYIIFFNIWALIYSGEAASDQERAETRVYSQTLPPKGSHFIVILCR